MNGHSASWGAVAGLGLALLWPAAGAAQAICSAPHSSPTLAQSGAIGTMPAGAGWLQLSVYRQQSTEFFNPLGERQPFLADSEFDTRSVFVTGAVGLTDGLELWAQVPVHRLGVVASSGTSRSSGLGDLRVAARLGPALVDRELPLALRVGVKVPGSDFPVDATVLPLTEGQVDVEVSLESGGRIGFDGPYVVGWAGWRWRAAHEEIGHEPGDELFGHVALGGVAGTLYWEVGADAMRGASPREQGIVLDGHRRRLLQLLATLGHDVGPGRLELTTQLPLWGRNLPTGTGWSVGYRTVWGL